MCYAHLLYIQTETINVGGDIYIYSHLFQLFMIFSLKKKETKENE